MKNLLTICLMSLAVLLLSSASALAAGNARTATSELIAAFKGVQTPGKGAALSPAQLKANSLQFRKIDALIHRPSVVDETIAPQKSALTAEELAQFKTLFWRTLRAVAYSSSGEFFRTAKYQIAEPQAKVKTVDVLVHAELTEDDIETDVTFHWKKHGGRLQLVDVSFDGASLVLDYKNQFGRIVKKQGGAGLVKLLLAKSAEATRVPVTDEQVP